MSSIQIPIQFTDGRGNLTPLSREAMYKIAELFAASRPGVLPEQFNFSPVTGTPFGAVYLNSSGQVVSTAAMTNGQILIGRTGSNPILGTLTGTSNQITVTLGSGTITVGIGSAYAGQASISTVGTLTSGIWQATAIAAGYGGTGQTTYTIGDLLYASGATALSKLADVATGNALLSGGVGVAPAWGKVSLTAHISGILPVANGGTGVSSAPDGTYTPTLTNVANLDASTAYQCQYFRVGNKVMVSGMVDVDPTAATASTQLGISLPVASNFGAVEDCGGTAFATGVAGQGGGIIADVANNRAQLQFISADTTNQPMAFSFMYDVI